MTGARTAEMQTEILMEIGGEGGSINFVGARTDGNWQFRIETSDQSWMLEGRRRLHPASSPVGT